MKRGPSARPVRLDLRHAASICAMAAAMSSHAETIAVAGAAALSDALAMARPGDVIELADGVYSGVFRIDRSGTQAQPIRLCGSMNAILKNSGKGAGYGLHLDHVDYWILEGFTVADASKGIILDGASHNLLRRLHIHNIGAEGVHFRAFSSYNILEYSAIYDTGKVQPGYGEAVYIGSAQSNWHRYSGGKPDRSDHNRILFNRIGPGVSAEGIDVKEGTRGGSIRANRFDGAGISGRNYADSMIDLKGNDYIVEENTFVSSGSEDDRILNGIQVHRIMEAWGDGNIFRGNRFDLLLRGLGIQVQKGTQGNRVCASNVVKEADAGNRLTNLAVDTEC